MKTWLKGTFLTALPLAALLFTAPSAEARHHHHYWRDRPHCRPYYGQGWYDRGRYNNYYRRGWYGDRRPYYDNNYPYPRQPYYGGYPWWSTFFNR